MEYLVLITDLKKCGAKFTQLDENELLKKVSNDLINEKAIGWFQGRMEFGPRALGSRSIIADPRSSNMQKNLNLKVKFRESFRPFAPIIKFENLNDWFDLNTESPYMLLVANIKKIHKVINNTVDDNNFGIDNINDVRSSIPAVTHIDFSARIQTVHKETNNKLYSLLENFEKLTNVPILVNTSFNVRGEPIVCTPEDAFRCFMGTNIDILVCENFLLLKNEQLQASNIDYKDKFKLD